MATLKYPKGSLYLAAIRSTLRTALPLVLVGVVALLIVIRCGKTGASMTPAPPVPAPDTPAVSTVLPSGGGSGRGAALVQL